MRTALLSDPLREALNSSKCMPRGCFLTRPFQSIPPVLSRVIEREPRSWPVHALFGRSIRCIVSMISLNSVYRLPLHRLAKGMAESGLFAVLV